MITFVMTSCGRVDLLKRTFSSFMRHNDIPIEKYIIVDDSAGDKVREQIEEYITMFDIDFMLIFNKENIGQVKSIDTAYSFCETEYIFHCENDWEFYRMGFMSKSLGILEQRPEILTVWLRDHSDTNGHPIDDKIYHVQDYEMITTTYQLMALNALGGNWHGYTWNPGLRRRKDYDIIKPFEQFIRPGDFAALTECRIGLEYLQRGFRAAILQNGYCKHIG